MNIHRTNKVYSNDKQGRLSQNLINPVLGLLIRFGHISHVLKMHNFFDKLNFSPLLHAGINQINYTYSNGYEREWLYQNCIL